MYNPLILAYRNDTKEVRTSGRASHMLLYKLQSTSKIDITLLMHQFWPMRAPGWQWTDVSPL